MTLESATQMQMAPTQMDHRARAAAESLASSYAGTTTIKASVLVAPTASLITRRISSKATPTTTAITLTSSSNKTHLSIWPYDGRFRRSQWYARSTYDVSRCSLRHASTRLASKHGSTTWYGPCIGGGPGAPQSQQQQQLNGDGQNLANRMGGSTATAGLESNLVTKQVHSMPVWAQEVPEVEAELWAAEVAVVEAVLLVHSGLSTIQHTLVIENVPAEHLDLIKVNEYFKKFGTITNISIDKPGSKALVSYSQPNEAKAAHESPDVIFGNRFVKVYFQRLDEAAGGPSASQAPTPRPPPQAARPNFAPGSNVYHARPPVGGGSAPGGAAGGGMSEERKKLLEDQRTKQAQLDAKLAEQKGLLAKFGDKDLSAEDKKATMTQLKKLGDEIKSSTEALKAAVEALQSAPKEAPTPAAAAAAAAAGGGDAGNWKAEKEKREKEQLDANSTCTRKDLRLFHHRRAQEEARIA